jgi:glutamate synthase domain-containing protein 3
MQVSKKLIVTKVKKDEIITSLVDVVEIDAAPNENPLDYKELNENIHQAIKKGYTKIILNNVCGQRFIGASLQGNFDILINGLPGNDLGIFMDGPNIIVNGNCEDQIGNTMNSGSILISGSAGDVLGLSSRGGKIYIKEDVGYRVGIHMKEFGDKFPTMIIGGTAKDFLGEYMAGGIIIVLGLKVLKNGIIQEDNMPICGNGVGTGMHRGMIILRTEEDLKSKLGVGTTITEPTDIELKEINQYVEDFCSVFDIPIDMVNSKPLKIIKPISKRPYASNYCSRFI